MLTRSIQRLVPPLKRLVAALGFILLTLIAVLGIVRLTAEVLNAQFIQNYAGVVESYVPEHSEDDVRVDTSPLSPSQRLNAISIDGHDWVGILEIPSLNVRMPVSAKQSDSYIHASPYVFSGSPYKSSFIIGGQNYQSQFFSLTSLEDNAQIFLTDMLGQRFSYRVRGVGDVPHGAEDLLRSQSEPWDLTLFTPSLSTYQWNMVRCVRE